MSTRLAQKYSNQEYIVLASIVACPQCKNQLRNDSIEEAFVAMLDTQSSIIDLKNNAKLSIKSITYACRWFLTRSK